MRRGGWDDDDDDDGKRGEGKGKEGRWIMEDELYI